MTVAQYDRLRRAANRLRISATIAAGLWPEGKTPDLVRALNEVGDLLNLGPLGELLPPRPDPDPDFANDSEPDASTGVPLCSAECRHHDGKRCRLLGFRPDRVCEIEVAEVLVHLGREAAAADSARADLATAYDRCADTLAQMVGEENKAAAVASGDGREHDANAHTERAVALADGVERIRKASPDQRGPS